MSCAREEARGRREGAGRWISSNGRERGAGVGLWLPSDFDPTVKIRWRGEVRVLNAWESRPLDLNPMVGSGARLERAGVGRGGGE